MQNQERGRKSAVEKCRRKCQIAGIAKETRSTANLSLCQALTFSLQPL